MAIPHAASGDLIDIRPYGPLIGEAVTKALFKTNYLEVIRMVLPAGKTVPQHQVDGEMTVQCIEGVVQFHTPDRSQVMQAGSLLHLTGGIPYWIDAVENASLLITFQLAPSQQKDSPVK